jgi:hypothetical protein
MYSAFARGLCLALPGIVGAIVLSPASAFASGAQVFPVPTSWVPLVVAAAFMLPALAASVLSLMRRGVRRAGPVASAALVMAAAAVAVAYLQPQLLSALRI